MKKRLLSALAGIGLVAAAFPLAAYLAADAWTPGAVGFWLLLALAGLALLAHATRLLHPLWLAPVLPLAVGLIGLDVTDSARSGVVTAGYVVAGLGAAGALAAAVGVHRHQPAAA
jgi:hypothetical protein